MDVVERVDRGGTGPVVLASVALAALARWVARLTSGPAHGGRWDLPVVHALAWFAFLVFVAAFVMAAAAGAMGLVHLAGRRRAGRRDAGPGGPAGPTAPRP